MLRTIGKYVCLTLFTAAIVASSSIGGEKLRYQMAKGSSHQYVLTSESKNKTQVGGQEMAGASRSYFSFSFTVENVDADGMSLVAKVDSNLSSVESMMMKDSALVVKEMNGKRIRLTVSSLGKVKNVAMIDTIVPPRAAQMAGIGNPSEFMRQLFVKLPDQAVGVGDTWKVTNPDTINARGMNLITKPDIEFKIAGTEKVNGYDCLKITFEGTSSIYGSGSQQGMEMVVDGTSKSKGMALFAPKEGLLVSVESEGGTDMNISGTGEQMFTAVQTISTSAKMKLVK